MKSNEIVTKNSSVSAEMLEKWRLLDEGKLFATPDEKRNKQWNKILADLRHEDISFDGSWFKIVSHDFDGYTIKTRLEIESDIRIDNFKSIKSTLAEIREKSLVLEVDKVKAALERKIESFELDQSERTFLLKNLSLEYKNKKLFDIKSNTFNSLTQKILEPLNRLRQATRIINTLQIDKYENSFPLARSMHRQINIIVGPTNSGKTWEALERLKAAKSGIYLAPLRLLALEIYEKLTEYGVPCNLITGEEHIIHPDAQHTAATVEMFDSQKAVEVAIIDEFQMLYDKQRGWAWTAAMVGVPAQEVFVIGAYQALPITQKLFEKIGEKYQVIEKERLYRLTVMNSLVSLNDLKKGDAIIAFSRKDVLSYATVLRKKKFKVSVIYGALSPEVRRRQAELFANGMHDIVVSTDAIGMGLNLPISRILFGTIRKYDGEQVRELNATEIHQIAGRAGRYGIHEEGFVSLLQNKVNQKSDLTVVKHTLGNLPPVYKDPLSVAPNNWHIQKLSEILKETNLKKILIYFSSMTNDSIFQHANLEHMCLIYDRLDVYLKKFPLLEQYKLVCAPVSEHEEEVISYYAHILVKLARNEPLSFSSPSYTQEKTPAYLERAEEDTKKLTLYMWLSHYYKNMETDNIPQIRKDLSNYVSRALTSQNMESFSKMIEPYVSNYSRHDRYNPYDDDENF